MKSNSSVILPEQIFIYLFFLMEFLGPNPLNREFINSWVLILQTEIGMYPKASAIHDSMDHDEIEPEPKMCNLDGIWVLSHGICGS